MMRTGFRMKMLFAFTLMLPMVLSAQIRSTGESAAERDARMHWWREARFGMFIHWGLYALPARGEWVMHHEKIPVEEYEKLAAQFNPVKFSAVEWVRMAKAAGMKYIVITSKHHDGFCMWDSDVSRYDIVDATPFKRDVLRELADACKNEGIRFCLYHSIMDWHHPDASGERFERYRDEYLRPQLRELLRAYGPIGVLWFDGDWIPEWTDAQGRELADELRRIQPDLIINNRIGVSRSGMAGMTTDPSSPGDFGTPEQEIPPNGLPGVDWESCMTMNDNWGYHAGDTNWKSTTELIRNLIDVASKGGNYLLNVGPTAEGIIPEEDRTRLIAIGEWLDRNGEAIYGTQPSPFAVTPWGRCTMHRRPGGRTLLYLHLFHWPLDELLEVPGLGNAPSSAFLLAEKSRLLDIDTDTEPLTIRLPASPPDPYVNVAVLEYTEPPLIFAPPVIEASQPIFVKSLRVSIQQSAKPVTIHYTLDGSEPTPSSLRYGAPITIRNTTLIRARAYYRGRAVSDIVEREFVQVTPEPGRSPLELVNMLWCDYYEGDWDSLPLFRNHRPVRSGPVERIDLSMRQRDEKFAMRFSGYFHVSGDDVYTFSLTSDDGSRLVIADNEIINNDGLHIMQTQEGHIALGRGKHTIEIYYFNKLGNMGLDLKMKSSEGEWRYLQASETFH